MSSNRDFPHLIDETNPIVEPAVWNCEKRTFIRDDAKYYANGDRFEGDFDDNGLPCYGKITFANGTIYEGPIRSHWVHDEEEQIDAELYDTWSEDQTQGTNNENAVSQQPDDDYEYYEEYPEDTHETTCQDKYGKFTYPDGKIFWCITCFGDISKWR